MADKINAFVKKDGTRVAAIVQSRFELAKVEAIYTDESNENDIRIVAGDECGRWDKPKFKDELIKEWNEAHPEK